MRRLPVFAANQDYAKWRKKFFGPSIVSYLPLGEAAGGVAFDYSGHGRNGAYTAVTLGAAGIGDGRSAASFNGTTSFCNWYSSGLAGAFNGAEGTLIIWGKVSGAGVWSDGANRYVVVLAADTNNLVEIRKTTTANQLRFNHIGAATSKLVLSTALNGSLSFFHAALSWSVSGNAMKAYLNGAQTGTTQTSLGTYTGSPASTFSLIGCTATAPNLVSSGFLAHALLLDRAATAAEIQDDYRVGSRYAN